MRSILDIDNGNIIRLIDNELGKVLMNINDISTDLKAREIKISLQIKPLSKERNAITVKPKITSKISPVDNEPITLSNTVEFDKATGEAIGSRLKEIGSVVPGQLNLDGQVTPKKEPILVGDKLIKKYNESKLNQ